MVNKMCLLFKNTYVLRQVTFLLCSFCFLCYLNAKTPPSLEKNENQKTPKTCVLSTIKTALAGLQIIDKKKRQEAFETLICTFFDISRMSDYVAGPYANKLTPQKRRTYENLMISYTANLYLEKFDSYGKGLTISHFTIGRSFPLSKTGSNILYVVKTELLPEGYTAPVTLDWYLIKNTGAFYILDIHIAGISFLRTKRDEFQTILKQNGLDAFLSRIRTILAKKGIKI